ncbi:MAG: hypothetical protein ETSY1_40300 [Candidatus Entotheonella factor]|uniref:Uncharacterized protein n=1 Tax=Entotheonella factor TaxID=1429438 RepID=W4L752_ENTF1|nr:hypothetical protein [Candidatus Entotheonella palauensis]ETW93186.1 MAG: hypothetical protein ETSY1_40300 [Candidatus Entotheonella factor]
MNESNPWRETWQQMAADAAVEFGRLLKTEREACRIMRKHLLQAQAEVLKGMLAVVETRLANTEPGGTPPAGEKITVE